MIDNLLKSGALGSRQRLQMMKNLTSQKIENKKSIFFLHDDCFSDRIQKLLMFSLGDYIVFLGLKSMWK